MLEYIIRLLHLILQRYLKFLFLIIFFVVIILLILILILIKNFNNLMEKMTFLENLSTGDNGNEDNLAFNNSFIKMQNDFQELIAKINHIYQNNTTHNKNIERALYIANDTWNNITQNIDCVFQSLNKLSIQLGKTASCGNFGEYSLENTLKLLGLVRNKEYKIQEILPNNSRPDATVFFKKGKYKLFIDAKTSLISGNINSLSDSNKNLVNKYKRNISILASKKYNTSPNSLPFCILYLPTDNLLIQLLQADPSIIQMAKQNNVYFGSPTTLPMIILVLQHIFNA